MFIVSGIASATKWTSIPTSTPSYREHLQAFGRAGGVPLLHITSTTSEPFSYHTRLHALNSRKIRPSNDHSVSILLRRIEQALDTNQPLDEKYIKSALRTNRKLSKILVDAYRQRQSLMNSGYLSPSNTAPTVIKPYPPSSTESSIDFTTATESTSTPTSTTSDITSTTTAPTSASTYSTDSWATARQELVDFTATTPEPFDSKSTTTRQQLLYWPKTGGYVPNTRKHASEITAQLYMTNEIVQTLADDPLPVETNPECELINRF